ncbi:MAG: type II toxin-antitoxin system RelE/ParE family toxin [Flavobacterium sp.]|nr:type II toxin-antitoxin system RelE/ParE family toxin [Flavobacterium sp.]
MEIEFIKNFTKILDKTLDEILLKKVQDVIDNVIKVQNFTEIPNLKKMVGYEFYHRIKIGDYRVSFEFIDNKVRFLTIKHPKDIYKKFL